LTDIDDTNIGGCVGCTCCPCCACIILLLLLIDDCEYALLLLAGLMVLLFVGLVLLLAGRLLADIGSTF